MKTRFLTAATIAALLGGAAAWSAVSVGAQVPPEKLRFRLVGDEQIATLDGRAIVSGFKVLVLRDTKSDQCYVSFINGSSMAVTGPSVCP